MKINKYKYRDQFQKLKASKDFETDAGLSAALKGAWLLEGGRPIDDGYFTMYQYDDTAKIGGRGMNEDLASFFCRQAGCELSDIEENSIVEVKKMSDIAEEDRPATHSDIVALIDTMNKWGRRFEELANLWRTEK